eukprot:3622737-Ditylum_brightwellii.AAC.1
MLHSAPSDPEPPSLSEDAFHSQLLFLWNTPFSWCNRTLIVAHNHPSESNKHVFCKAKNDLATAVCVAKSDWACTLAYSCMKYKTNPIKSWKAIRTLGKGLTHHHVKCCTIQMCKADKTKAVTDEESTQSTFDLIEQHDNYTHFAAIPSGQEVCTALCCMANGKAPGPSCITSDALKSM